MNIKTIARAARVSTIAGPVLFVGMLLFGCESQPLESSDVGTRRDGLSLTVAESDHIAGSFSYQGTGIDFDSSRDAAGVHVTLKTPQGEVLLALRDDLVAKRQTIEFGKRLSQTVSHRLLSTPTLDGAPDPSEFQTSGDIEAAQDFGKYPEYRILPDLSRSLGELGFDGRSYPAALPLHLLALRANEELERGLPSPESSASTQGSGEPEAPGVEPQGLAPGGTCFPIKCPNGGTACLGSNGCFPGGGPDRCPTNFGQDLQSDPCQNKCYGMCGSECSCWSWVCGDCNYHSGCAAHDDWCRSCSIWAPWNCALCYSPTALVGLDCRL